MKLRPLGPYPGAVALWSLKCLVCGHQFWGRWSVLKNGKGCPDCRRARVARTVGRDRARQAERDLRAAGMEPLEPYRGAHTPWRSKCVKCGSVRSPRLAGIRSGQGACKVCGSTVSAEKRRTPRAEALKIMKNAGLIPDLNYEYVRTTDPWPCTCVTCGARVRARINTLKKGKRGCKRCAMVEGGIGFDVWSPGVIYLIAHDGLGALKVGITSTNTTHQRLVMHGANGWTVLREWSTETGQQAVFVEGEVLRWLRDDLDAHPCVEQKNMPQGGWTETVSISEVSASAISRKISNTLKKAENLPPLPNRESSPIGRRTRCVVIQKTGNQCRRKSAIGSYCVNHATRLEKYGDPLRGPRTLGEKCLVVVEGLECGKTVRSRDMCSIHYERWYTYGDPHFMLRPTPGTRSTECIVEVKGTACGSKVVAHEMCVKHYNHWFRHGDPLAGRFENPGAPCCVVEDDGPCGGVASALGMCPRHYRRAKLYGDPLTTKRVPYVKRPKSCIAMDAGQQCGRKVVAHGLCNMHRKRAIKINSLDAAR